MSAETEHKMMAAANLLCKWRSTLAGWQLGTRSALDPECQAVRDHREVTMMLRAEVNGLTRLLIDAGLFTVEQFQRVMTDEYNHLSQQYEKQFPGFKPTEVGMSIDPAVARETTRNWRP